MLFICSRNRLRSPTAEAIFADLPGLNVASAGTSPDAEEQVTAEWVEWADLLMVMERRHEKLLNARFGAAPRGKRLVNLRIADDFGYMDPALVALLRFRAAPYL